MREGMDRATRIDLFFRGIQTFSDTFDERAFTDIPIEKREGAWDTFLETLRKLNKTHGQSSRRSE